MSKPRIRPALAQLLWLWLLMASGGAWAQPASISLEPGFTPDPQTFSGVAGGPVSAQGMGSSPLGACVGFVPERPQVEMTLDEPFEYLRVAVAANGQDTTLVIEGPVGHWCNDDDTGLDPAISGRWAAGDYRIFVGTYSAGQSLPYSLQVTTAPPTAPMAVTPPSTPGSSTIPGLGVPPSVLTPTGVPPGYPPGTSLPPPVPPGVPPGVPTLPPFGLDLASVSPTFGGLNLTPGFLPDPQTLSGTSGGSINGGSIGSSPTGPCRGWIASNPDHVVTLSGPFPYLLVDVTSAGDTTLIVQGPHGFWCNDDSVGLNPRIGATWSPGTYRIWIGSYSGGQYHPYTILFSQHYPR